MQRRHLSHTLLFAVALGAATAAGTEAGGPWAVAGVVLLGLLLAEDALGDWLLPVAGGAVVWWVYENNPGALDQLDAVTGLLGIAVALGCFTHCLVNGALSPCLSLGRLRASVAALCVAHRRVRCLPSAGALDLLLI